MWLKELILNWRSSEEESRDCLGTLKNWVACVKEAIRALPLISSWEKAEANDKQPGATKNGHGQCCWQGEVSVYTDTMEGFSKVKRSADQNPAVQVLFQPLAPIPRVTHPRQYNFCLNFHTCKMKKLNHRAFEAASRFITLRSHRTWVVSVPSLISGTFSMWSLWYPKLSLEI